jgi:hypothetical protein
MLRLVAEGPGGSFLAPSKVIVEVHRLTGVRLADYWCAAHDAFGRLVGEGRLRAYPRWTEALSGFAARCLTTLPPHAGRWGSPALSGERVVVIARGTRRLRELRARFDAERSELVAGTRTDVLPGAASELAVWQAVLALDGFDALEFPPLPAPLRLPLYRTWRGTYCRTSDLPSEARDAFRRWRLCVPKADTAVGPTEVQDAAIPAEVARFLGGVG